MKKSDLHTLRRIVGTQGVSDALEDRVLHSYDGTKQSSLPDVVVRPRSTEEVSEILKLANEKAVPVYPRGAASGLTGGAVPLHHGIALDMTAMNKILQIDPENSIATVQPGVVLLDFQQQAEGLGLFYPPDPASSDTATMGGTVAECAGGLRGLKYGVTRDYVLALEAVLANGTVLHTGAKTFKSVTGYDITRLFVGSEGTLGIFTEITVRLIPLPESLRTVLALFAEVDDAVSCARKICRSRVLPRACEFMDRRAIAAVRDYRKLNLPQKTNALLLVDTDGPKEATEKDHTLAVQICKSTHAIGVQTGMGSEDRERLWQVRRAVSPALYTVAPNKFNHDICVPRSRLADIMRWLERLAAELTVNLITFGHIAEGNIHVNLMFDHSPAQKREAEQATQKLFEKVIELGGTLSGEHGIGNRKAKYLALEISPAEIRLMRDIKKVFDPNNILNPGKIFP